MPPDPDSWCVSSHPSAGRTRSEAGVVVDDPGDERVARFRWRDPQLDPRQPAPGAPHGLFVAEGDLVVERALDAGYVPDAVLVDRRRVPAVIDRFPADVPVFAGDGAVRKELTGFGVALDIVALFHRRPARPLTEILARARRILVLEAVDNPTNLGAIVRSALALGLDALVIDETSADPFARRAIRASMGASLTLPVARTGAFPEGLASLVDHGFRLLALTLERGATELAAVRLAPTERAALMFGSERQGLSVGTAALAELVTIPMRAGVDSLNVAAAAAIACYVLGA